VAYLDRANAGDVLAEHLGHYQGQAGVIVLGLVRGGVPVAARIAAALALPLDVLVVRKLGVPWASEVAFGAVGPRAVVIYNEAIAARLSQQEAAAVLQRERTELVRRELAFRPGRPPLDLHSRQAIVVDDGLATGATARAAVAVARRLGAIRVVAAVPVGAPDALELLRTEVDELVCPLAPDNFAAVGSYYQVFGQVDDDEVLAVLAGAGSARTTEASG
jgi:predicted phosphoribosyltransferase